MKLHEKIRRLIELKKEALKREPRGYAQALEKQAAQKRREPRLFERAVKRTGGLKFICEYKPSSPSKGAISSAPLAGVLRAYEKGGADAVSVLTERNFFGGSLDALKEARKLTNLPLMRKDFVISEIEVLEAAAAGADAVLLIDGITPRMDDFIARAESFGMDCLAEAFDAEGIARCVDAGARIIGMNNRNFSDLSVDVTLAARLAGKIPRGKIFVAESGIETPEQVRYYSKLRVDALLVGTSLMASGNTEAKLKELKEAGG